MTWEEIKAKWFVGEWLVDPGDLAARQCKTVEEARKFYVGYLWDVKSNPELYPQGLNAWGKPVTNPESFVKSSIRLGLMMMGVSTEIWEDILK